MLAGARVAVVVASLAVCAGPASAAPVELHARRGVAGIVASGGIDVVEIEIRSAADVTLVAQLRVDGRSRSIDLAARGTAIVPLARRVPAGAAQLPAVPFTLRVNDADVAAVIPAAQVVSRPVIVLTDDPVALVPRVDEWRRTEQLGKPVVLSPAAPPVRWQALAGAGAIVLDRPLAALDPAIARVVRRHLATGGRVCRFVDAARPTCVHPAAIHAPTSPRPASLGALVRRLAGVALAVAAALRRRRPRSAFALAGAAIAIGALAPLAGSSTAPRLDGMITAVDEHEDWIVAAIGVADDGGDVELSGDLFIEPYSSGEAGRRLDELGLRGRVPGTGTWLVRGFVPAGSAWTAPLVRNELRRPEAP
jgi:hypothetical protein